MGSQNKVMISGLALYRDAAPESLCSCNFDMSWLFRHPSTLLWAEKIIVTPTMLELGSRGDIPSDDRYRAVDRDLTRMLFDVVGSCDLFELKNPSKTLPKAIVEIISTQASEDVETLAETCPAQMRFLAIDDVTSEPNTEHSRYCVPRVVATYLGVVLSGAWDAQMILTPDEQLLLERTIWSRQRTASSTRINLQAFTEIVRGRVPELDMRAHAACWNCKASNTCDKHSLRVLERRLRRYLQYRDFDEIIQMKTLIGKLNRQLRSQFSSNPSAELYQSFIAEEQRISRQLHRVLPRIKRWSALSTIVSVPIVVAGINTESSLVAGLGAAIAGIAQAANQYVNYLTSKHNWVFLQQSND